MYNTSVSLIPITVIENNQSVYSVNIPYALLPIVYDNIASPERRIDFNIDGNISSNTINQKDGWFENIVSTTSTNHPWNINYNTTVNAKRLRAIELNDKASFEQAENLANQEKAINDARALQQQAKETFDRYQEMLLEQKQLTEEQIQIRQAEQLRQDENRLALVRGIALDPSTAPAALASEFGQSGDIRRQVAAVMENDISISKLIAQTNPDCWTSSYEIMSILGTQCSEDKELAQIVSTQLPDDSSLKQMLKGFGWVS
jgi:hypothetical protein